MSGLDYSKARNRARLGASHPSGKYYRRPHRGWRTEYPQDFPVVVTRMATPKQTDSKMLSNLDQGQETA